MGRAIEVEAQRVDGEELVVNPETAAQVRLGPIDGVTDFEGQTVPYAESLIKISDKPRVARVLIASVETPVVGEDLMKPGDAAERARFMVEEYGFLEGLRERTGLREDSLVPLVMSIRGGNHWSIVTGETRAVSVVNRRTTVEGRRTLEDVYLLEDPELQWQEGSIRRLEREAGERYIVGRPYRVGVQAGVMLMATLDPRSKTIEVEDLGDRELLLTGSPAYALSHEMDHLRGEALWDTGEPIWTMRYKH